MVFFRFMQKPTSPIGIFDSGVGGLTVAHAIKQILPNEPLVYFGDTAHLPYGDKSAEAIIYYSDRIADFLLEQGAKVLVVACNSASASAWESLSQKLGGKLPLLNVIDPVVKDVNRRDYQRVGLIGTKRTIDSGTYEQKLKEGNGASMLSSMATPLLVPMIEEGFIFDDISNAIIRSYLSKEAMRNLDALILGCTHYPIIKNQINKFFNFSVDILDSSRIVAQNLQQILSEHKLLNTGKQEQEDVFFVSDYTPYFEKIARMFFEEHINLQQKDLWR